MNDINLFERRGNNMLKKLFEMTILIVDDDSITQKLLKGILEKQGYNKILMYNSGEQTLELIKKDRPDLVLLDIFMPGIEGYEVCRRLKADNSTSHIPIIMVTGGPVQAEEAIEKSFNAGAADFITKPIRTIEFLSRVKSGLTIKRSHDLLVDELYKREQAEKENKKLIEKLKQALLEIKSLKGIIPICSYCKKIRDDKGYWNKLEAYIQEHSEAEFSHSICPECSDKLYGNEDWYIAMEKKKNKK